MSFLFFLFLFSGFDFKSGAIERVFNWMLSWEIGRTDRVVFGRGRDAVDSPFSGGAQSRAGLRPAAKREGISG